MKIINMRLVDLKPYVNNPRNNDNAVQYVRNSIEEFGFRVPLVIDKDNVIVCGHTRYKAAVQMGLEEVPCILAADLTEDQIKAFRLADNKTQELAEWDWNKIGIELDSITGIDMSRMGFEDFLDKSDPGELPVKKLGGGNEIDLGSFDDEEFEYVCPCCGFRFNER